MLLRTIVASLSTITMLALVSPASEAMPAAAVPASTTSGLILVQAWGPGGSRPGGPSRRPGPSGRPGSGPWAGGWHPPPRPRGWVAGPLPRGGWGWGRPAGYWWGPGTAVAAGAAVGFLTAAAAGAFAPPPPAPRLCWFYTNPSRTTGFWDSCP
jgi:hypothetical protein